MNYFQFIRYLFTGFLSHENGRMWFMRYIKYLLLVMTAALLFQWNCTKEPVDNTPPETTTQSVIGNWQRSIGPIAALNIDLLNITLIISEDSTFSLELNQNSEKVLFSSEGHCVITEDSIFLNSSECMILDTVPDPDTLAPLADSVCTVPIPLALPEAKAEWDIQTANLAVMLSAFPIKPELISSIPIFIPIITLVKEEE